MLKIDQQVPQRLGLLGRVVTPFVAAVGLLVVLAAPAVAHVTVSSDNATKGGYATITIRVPNEESDATTVGLKLQLPVDHPIANVSVQPKPGWTFKTTTSKLTEPLKSGDGTIDEAVTEIDWTGGKIAPGEFDQFLIQAGPLPTDTDSLTFKAIQTYQSASGKTSQVAWIQEAEPGQAEPENPAPVLQLTDAATDASTASTDRPSVTATASSKNAGTGTKSSSDTALTVFALAFGAAGLIMAIVALVVAVAARQKLSLLRGPQDDR